MTERGIPTGQRVLMDACLSHRVPFCWRTPGTLLIAVGGLRAAVAEANSQGLRLLGLEAFELAGAAIHPRLDLVVDLSRLPAGVDPLAVADSWPRDVWVDVTLEQV